MTRTVLLVDDEPNIILSLEFLIEQAGYKSRVARDGEAALKAIEEHKPDLVLLDVMLPKRDGFDVCERIRANPAWKDIRIVMLTAKGRDSERGKRPGAGRRRLYHQTLLHPRGHGANKALPGGPGERGVWGMSRPGVTGEGLFFLFLLGVFLFNPPLLSIFDIPRQLFGVPLLYIYLFACWGALLLLVAFIIEKSGDADELQDSGDEAAGKDRSS